MTRSSRTCHAWQPRLPTTTRTASSASPDDETNHGLGSRAGNPSGRCTGHDRHGAGASPGRPRRPSGSSSTETRWHASTHCDAPRSDVATCGSAQCFHKRSSRGSIPTRSSPSSSDSRTPGTTTSSSTTTSSAPTCGARPGWTGAYDHRDPFLEPLVLFAYLAGVCDLEVVTDVLVLPQRQTRSGGEAGRHARPPRARACPPRRGHRVERRRVPGARDRFPSIVRPASRSRSLCCAGSGPSRSSITPVRRRWSKAAGISPLPPGPVPIWIGCGTASRGIGACRAARRRVAADATGTARPRVRTGVAPRCETAAAAAGRDPDALGLEGQRLGAPRTRWHGRRTVSRDGAMPAPARWRSTPSGPAPGGPSSTSRCCCAPPKASAELRRSLLLLALSAPVSYGRPFGSHYMLGSTGRALHDRHADG